MTTESIVRQEFDTGVDGVLALIAADYRRRLQAGGTEPPVEGLRLVREHRLGAVRLAR